MHRMQQLESCMSASENDFVVCASFSVVLFHKRNLKKHGFYYKNKFFQPRKNIGLKEMRYQNFVFLILLGEIPSEFL